MWPEDGESFAPSPAARIEGPGVEGWKVSEVFRPRKEAGGERVLEGPTEPAGPPLLLCSWLWHWATASSVLETRELEGDGFRPNDPRRRQDEFPLHLWKNVHVKFLASDLA